MQNQGSAIFIIRMGVGNAHPKFCIQHFEFYINIC